MSEPNFLIMMADDLGYGDIGCYGNNTIKTPNIDLLALNGIKLTHHLAASSVCTPSRSAFLTGRYPIRSGMAETGKLRVLPFVASSGGLPSNETTFANVLKNFGYSTALIGKWHLGVNCRVYNDNCHHPLNHGFDYFYGLPLTNLKDFGNDGAGVFMSNNPRIKTGLKSAILTITLGALFIARYYSSKRPCCTFFMSIALTALPLTLFYLFITNIKILNSVLMLNTTVVEQPINFGNDLSQRLLGKGIEFLTHHAALQSTNRNASNKQQPFLLFFSFLQVHTALHTAPRFSNTSIHGRFGDNVQEMDWMVGKLVQTLDELGLRNDTFVYFTSDQGGHIEEKGLDGQREGGFNAYFKGGKGQGGMEGGIRVPGIINYPPLTDQLKLYCSSHQNDSQICDRDLNVPTSLMDLWPTIVNLAKPTVMPNTFHSTLPKHQFPDATAVFDHNFLSEEDDDYDEYFSKFSHHQDYYERIDGRDLMPLLINFTHYHMLKNESKFAKTNTSPLFSTNLNNDESFFYYNHHEFLFHYCGTDIHAVRYMPKNEKRVWKIYFVTPKWIPGTQECHYVCFCYGKRNVIRHDPPLLYELMSDPFEDRCILPPPQEFKSSPPSPSSEPYFNQTLPPYSHCYKERIGRYNRNMVKSPPKLDAETGNEEFKPRYYEILSIVKRAVEKHKYTIQYVPNQFSARNTMWKPWLQPCCNPPWCHCKE